MPELNTYDYAIVRVVPRVERGEFVNAGVILSCAGLGHLQARIELDEARLIALDAHADLPGIRAALATLPLICAGGKAAGALGKLSVRERFHWLAKRTQRPALAAFAFARRASTSSATAVA